MRRLSVALPRKTLSRSWATYLVLILAAGLGIPPTIHLVLTLVAGIWGTATGSPLIGVETIDRLTWLVILATAFILFILLVRLSRKSLGSLPPIPRNAARIAALIVAALWLLSISWIQVLPDRDPQGAWWGFGDEIALISIAIAALLLALGADRITQTSKPFLAIIGVAIVLVWYVPLIIQPPWGVFDSYHTRYVVNEVLAPLSGNFALGSFASLYTTLLGLPLLILQPLTSLSVSLPYYAIAVSYLSLLALATFVILVFTARLALPSRLKTFAPLILLPVILVSQPNPSGFGGTITAGLSAYPGRILGFAAVALLLLRLVQFPSRQRATVLGLVAGAAAINNFEFGISGLVALVTVLVLAQRLSRPQWLYFVLSLPVIPLLYVLVVFLANGDVHFEYFTVFALSFGGGFGNIAMPVIGSWTAVAGLLVTGAAVGSWLLLRRQRGLLVPASLAAFAGIAGVLQFGYYVGRSSTYGQLQLLLTHLALVLVAIIALSSQLGVWRQRSPQVGILIMICALPLAALVNVRPPVEEWSRISPLDKGTQVLSPDNALEQVVAAVKQAETDFPDSQVGVATEAGNYVELSTGANNLLLTDSPFDPVVATGLQDATCSSIRSFDGIIVIHPLLERLPDPYCGLEVEPYVNGTLVASQD